MDQIFAKDFLGEQIYTKVLFNTKAHWFVRGDCVYVWLEEEGELVGLWLVVRK